jgi:hypothetical protein
MIEVTVAFLGIANQGWPQDSRFWQLLYLNSKCSARRPCCWLLGCLKVDPSLPWPSKYRAYLSSSLWQQRSFCPGRLSRPHDLKRGQSTRMVQEATRLVKEAALTPTPNQHKYQLLYRRSALTIVYVLCSIAADYPVQTATFSTQQPLMKIINIS